MRTIALRALMVILVSSCFAPVALADDPVWSYIEAGYLSVDPDNLSGSGDNWFAGASFGFFKHFHAFGRYIDGDYATNVDNTFMEFGAGWHGLLGDQADVLAEVSWLDSEVGAVNDDGYQITGGVRWLPVALFELDGFVSWADLDQAGSDTSFEVRAIVNVWRMGFGASYEMADAANQWNVFARFNFGR